MLKGFLKSPWFYFSLLIVVTIPLCLGLSSGNLINGHDAMAALIRAMSMNKYMGHGQFLVRWSPEINWGYGYPMFNFYPPFFSFISVMIFQVTQNMAVAINWACILFWILSGIGMFLFAREFWGDEGGMLSALLYVYAPYHILDLYIRGAFAEFSSFAFFPFILLSIWKISRKVSLGFFLLGIGSIFGLSLTHNIMSMLFFPVAAAYMFYLFFFEKRSLWIAYAVAMFIIGLMLSSFFWLPALLEKEYLNLNFLIGAHYDFHDNFISFSKLFWPFNKWTMDHISFQVGVIHSLFCLGTAVFLPKIFKINRSLGLGYVFFLSVGLISVFFTLPYSSICWEHINILRFIQFPWRILVVTVFTMSFLCGSILLLISNSMVKKAFLIAAGLFSIMFYLKILPEPAFITNKQNIEDFLALGEGEYTPKWVLVPPDKRPDSKFQIIRGNGQFGEEKALNPVRYEIKFQGLEQSLVCFHTFYFPGWQVYIDGQPTEPHLDNPFGLVLFSVPSGEHDIQVVFGSTLVRTISVIISWVGVVLLLGGILLFKTKRV